MNKWTVAALLASSLLFGCSNERPTPDAGIPYTELEQGKATVSGVTYDPEAFFFVIATWPEDAGNPEELPPPAMFAGSPYVVRSVVPDVKVAVQDGPTIIAESQEPSNAEGYWQASGVPMSQDKQYTLLTLPPQQPLTIGADFPEPWLPIPATRYHRTKSIRPMIPRQSYCVEQVGITVGEKGALEAIAKAKTAAGSPTTVADLLDKTKTGGVVLVWAFGESFYLDFFLFPTYGMELTADRGEVFALDWAPPGVAGPDQSELGYLAMPDKTSMLAYWAVVLPPGPAAPLTVSINDPVVSEEEGRPYTVPGFTAVIDEQLSFHRAFGVANNHPEPDPLADPLPDYYPTWFCGEE